MQSGAVGYDISLQPSMASQFSYDSNGNMASRIDALGRTTSYTYDSLGHKLTMTEPLPNSSTSPSAATTSYTYDAFGNLTQTAAPLGRTTSSTYDGNGNKLTDTDAGGNTTSYQYDALNRLTLNYDTPPLKGLRLQPERLRMGLRRNGEPCGWSVFFVVASATGAAEPRRRLNDEF